MATVSPLRGIHYNPAHVSLGGVLAPPYDVISDVEREALYARDLRNIVRIDYCRPEPADPPEGRERYRRAAQHLEAWLRLELLVRDEAPSVYVSDHEFTGSDGATRRRRGVFLTVPALRWEAGEIRPHERTLRGPKEDRLALLRATRTQTSAVWALWDRAPGIDAALSLATRTPALLGGRTQGEQGSEKHLLWAVSEPTMVESIVECLSGAQLYIADGHHRFETGVAYAEERRADREGQSAAGGEPAGRILLYLSAADDPDLELLPTHRLVHPAAGVPATLTELAARLPAPTRMEPLDSLEEAGREASRGPEDEHRFAVQAVDGAALLRLPRAPSSSPRARLDVVALQDVVLAACGVSAERIAEGALGYTRSLSQVDLAVRSGQAALGFGLRGCSTADLIAVSDAGETMPQKSTYFYPKVPTGLVLLPL